MRHIFKFCEEIDKHCINQNKLFNYIVVETDMTRNLKKGAVDYRLRKTEWFLNILTKFIDKKLSGNLTLLRCSVKK